MIPQTEAALSRLLGHTVGREMAEVIYWASSALLLGGPLLVMGLFLPVLRKLGAGLLFVFLAGVTPTMHDCTSPPNPTMGAHAGAGEVSMLKSPLVLPHLSFPRAQSGRRRSKASSRPTWCTF